MGVMKVAGKSTNNQVTAFGLENDGKVKVKRYWNSEVIKLLDNVQLREGSTVVTTAANSLDTGEYGFVSLRVSNSHNAALSIMIYEDVNASGDTWMTRLDGSNIRFDIPANASRVIITPEDIPELNYLKYLKFRVSAKTTPTEGAVTLFAVVKR